MKRKKSKCSSATRRKIAGGVALATTLAGSAATTTSQAWLGLEKIKSGFANTTNYLKSWFGGGNNKNDEHENTSATDVNIYSSGSKQETSTVRKIYSALISMLPQFFSNKVDTLSSKEGELHPQTLTESTATDSSEESGFLHKKLNDLKGGIKGAYDTTKNKLGQWVERSVEVAKKYPRITANLVGATAISGLVATGAIPASVAFKILTVAAPIVTDLAAGKKMDISDKAVNAGMLAASTVLAPYAFSVYPSSGSIFEKIGFGLVSMCGSAALGYVFRPKNIANAGLHLATGITKSAWDAGKVLVGFNEEEQLLSYGEIKNIIYDKGLDVLKAFSTKLSTKEKRKIVENFVAKEQGDLYEIYSEALEAVEKEDKESSDSGGSIEKVTTSEESKKDRVIKKMEDICKVKLDGYINNIQKGETKEEKIK